MKVYDATAIRNVALVGHSGAGKTQLASAVLADAGMVSRFGKVDEGTAVTDYDEEEIARKHTLSASLAYAEWNKHKINLIDTPGIGAFLSDARAGLHVADAALVVVDADAPLDLHRDPRHDAGDLTASEPDDRHRAGAVVQLALQRRDAAAWAERDAAQGAAQPHALTVGGVGDALQTGLGERAAHVPRVLVGAVRPRADGAAQPTLLPHGVRADQAEIGRAHV